MPKWSNPDRRACLIRLFERSQGFCIFGHRPCQFPSHHYELFIDDLIKDWQADDTAKANALWQAERKAMHSLGEVGRTRGEFSSIGREIFFARQPESYILALGVSAISFQPIAKVRLSSSYRALHVNILPALQGLPKNQRRKLLRYGKRLPSEGEARLHEVVKQAVEHYKSHR